jgi:N-acetyl-gamma-glutamyl-phosphate reductase
VKSAQLKTAVVGATGYAGAELTRLLLKHPRVGAPVLLSRQNGKADGSSADLADAYPQFIGNGAYPIEPFSWEKLNREKIELLFLATPHEVSREWVPQAMRAGLRVVDLSGAWRLQDESNRVIYGFKDADASIAAKVMDSAVYGLPELHRKKIADGQLVANPGCYATSIIVALAPLLRAGIVDPSSDIICDSKSGVSGAGKEPSSKTHFVEVADNLSAYAVFGHRHFGEILEQLGLDQQQIVFTPHLLPIPRGIMSTIYLRLKKSMETEEVEGILRKFYVDSPWVRIFGTKLPQIRYSLNTNYCDIGFNLAPDGRRVVMVSCLDNLLKGAAGQAVQNMNIMFGWDEREGLN